MQFNNFYIIVIFFKKKKSNDEWKADFNLKTRRIQNKFKKRTNWFNTKIEEIEIDRNELLIFLIGEIGYIFNQWIHN
jgi:hypothetical protein